MTGVGQQQSIIYNNRRRVALYIAYCVYLFLYIYIRITAHRKWIYAYIYIYFLCPCTCLSWGNKNTRDWLKLEYYIVKVATTLCLAHDGKRALSRTSPEEEIYSLLEHYPPSFHLWLQQSQPIDRQHATHPLSLRTCHSSTSSSLLEKSELNKFTTTSIAPSN